jgi:hypothetical protein
MYAYEVIACYGVDCVGVSGVKTFDFVVVFEVDCAFGKDCVFEVGCG